MTMIGRQCLEINHTRQPYDRPQGPTSNKKHRRRVLEENKLGRQLQTTDHTVEKHSYHPAHLVSTKHQPAIRFSLETRPFWRETTVHEPRQ
jgi:hypothetical protein